MPKGSPKKKKDAKKAEASAEAVDDAAPQGQELNSMFEYLLQSRILPLR